MLDFGLLQEFDVEKGGETQGVEAGVAWHVRAESLWLGEEGDGGGRLHGD